MLPQITKDYSKTDIKKLAANSAADLTENGRIIEVAEMISKMEFFIKELKSNPDYIEYLQYEVAKFGKQTTTPSGTKIELAEVGTKYDYTFCEDDDYNELIVRQIAMEEQIKTRQTFLKSLPVAGIEILDSDGALKRIYPPSKHSTSSVKITIKN
jgi:hypothetical protein